MNRILFIGVMIAAGLGGGVWAADIKLTPAQALLFDGAHLTNVPPDSLLNYRFVKTGELGAFTDTVQVIVGKAAANGGKDLDLEFLTGERRLPAATFPGFRNNAVIMAFLQNDVIELEKQTGGSQLYFRNRIREAFALPLTLRKTAINFDGKTLPATEIVIVPFGKNPYGVAFKKFTRRSYRFVMSEDIPGEVYQMASTTRSAAGEVIIESTMTFAGMEKKK